MNLDWTKIKENLDKINVPYQKREAEACLSGFITQCGYHAQPMVVKLSDLDTVDADIGVIVTHENPDVNNGVYIFCVLQNQALGLITVIPSTISKSPVIRRVTGDVTNAVTGVVMPMLTTFDMIEITGQVIANTVMKSLITAFNIPKEKEHAFICLYLPKFLANVAMYYTGASDKNGNPMVMEEIADMEPAQIRQMVMGGDLSGIIKQPVAKKEKETDGQTKNETGDTAHV